MKIKTTEFVSPENEKLTVLFILNDANEEVERFSFYNEPRELKIAPELKLSIDGLPDLLERIYNLGLNNEKIEFIKEELVVD